MHDCLVTKLKESVNNNNLPILRCLEVKLPAGLTKSWVVNYVAGTPSGVIKIKKGTGHFVYNEQNVSEINTRVNVSTQFQVVSETEITVLIPNKYSLKTISLNQGLVNTNDIAYLDYSVIDNFNFCVDGAFDASVFPAENSIVSFGLGGSDVYGDVTPVIDKLANIISGYGENIAPRLFFYYNKAVGDLSLAHVTSGLFNQVQAKNDGRIFSWKNTREGYFLGLKNINLGSDVDAMLINQATLEFHSDASAGDKVLTIFGTRTSASDSAVATLKGRSVTITLNGEVL